MGEKEIIFIFSILLSTTVFGLLEDLSFTNRELTEDSKLFKVWVQPEDHPIYKQIYLFNVTNPDDIIQGNKPILQEMGPYTFRIHHKKENVSFDNDEGTVSYAKLQWYEFMSDKSSGSLTDEITVINVPFTNMAKLTEGKLSLMQRMMLPNFIKAHHVKPFIKKTVEQMLFEGYEDSFMIFLATQKGEEILPNGKFGFFYGQNYTNDGIYSIYTGIKDQSKFMQIHKWNNNDKLPYYSEEKCNKIDQVSDGSIFKNNIATDDILHLFTTDMCRTLSLKYEKEVNYRDLIAHQFSPPQIECLCVEESECTNHGAVSNQVCKHKSPRILSYPHFYDADDVYYEAVEGLNRDKDKHATTYIVEPKSGATLRYHRRLQVNLFVKPVDHIEAYKNFPQLIFPLLWFDETAELPDVFVDGIKIAVE